MDESTISKIVELKMVFEELEELNTVTRVKKAKKLIEKGLATIDKILSGEDNDEQAGSQEEDKEQQVLSKSQNDYF